MEFDELSGCTRSARARGSSPGLTRKSRLKPAGIAVRSRPRCAGPAARSVPGA